MLDATLRTEAVNILACRVVCEVARRDKVTSGPHLLSAIFSFRRNRGAL